MDQPPLPPRQRTCLNRQWRFFRGEHADAHRLDLEDGSWQQVGLPHTFDLPYFRTPEFYVGSGWYRRWFDFPENVTGKRVQLEFEGAFQVAEVFVNGVPAGRHEGGYTPFCVDVSDAIRPGPNLLAVRVNNDWNPRIAPRAGEHIFSGGLYRDVYLVITGPQHVAWHGVQVSTPVVGSDSAAAIVRVEVQNAAEAHAELQIEHVLHDPAGVALATPVRKTVSVPAGSTIVVEQAMEPVQRPMLWHPDHPHLYTLQTRIIQNQELVDEVATSFGFRWFEWTADRGFFLNGEHLYLRGANVHQDHAGWGIGITQGACERDVRLMKEAGFNFIRGAHYPHHGAFAEACDRLGMLLWSEACFWGKGGYGPEGYWNASAYPIAEEDKLPFEQSCKQMLEEMIRTQRNHPSIVVWSMTNEAFFTFNLPQARKLMREMVELSHDLDASRPAAIGGAQRGEVDRLGDIAGYNGDGARLFIDPGVPNMVSEYGAISKPHDAFEPFFGELQAGEYPWRSGQAIWCGFDYGSIAGRQGLKGIVQHNRLPKRSWYWYRQAYLGINPPTWPAEGVARYLLICADRTILANADAEGDCQIVVTAVDETHSRVRCCGPITLTIVSGPGEFPTGRAITFAEGTDVPVADGQAAIAFRTYEAGISRIRASAAGCEPVYLQVETLGEPRFEEGKSTLAAARLYHPPELSEAARRAMASAVDVARDRPSRASSEAAGHAARMANDGNDATFWQAANDDAEPWLQVDLEGFYQLSSCRLVFPQAGNARYLLQTSNDRQSWGTAIDRRGTVRTDAVRNDVFDPGTVARYVKICFARHAERVGLRAIELQGILSVR